MIRGKTRFFGAEEDKTPKGVGIHASIHNKFEIEVKDVTTGEVRQTGKAENIILDIYWTDSEQYADDRYCPGYYIAVGTGTGSISSDRTEMFNQVGRKEIKDASKKAESNILEKYSVFSGEIELLPSEYVGAELTEVGLFSRWYHSTYTGVGAGWKIGSLTTHALFKDANNNPISILKKSTDLITIKASVYLHYPNLDLQTAALEYSSVPWDGSLLPRIKQVFATTNGWNLGAAGNTGSPPSGNYTVDSTSKKVNIVLPRAQTTDLNGAPITKISPYVGDIYLQHIPQELYSDITNEVVGVGDGIKTGFSTYFPFPINAVVKVDGVVIPDTTVHQTYGKSFPTLAIDSFIDRIYEDGNLAPRKGLNTTASYLDRVTVVGYNQTLPAGTSLYFKNRFPEHGIYRIRGLTTSVEKFISDDLVDWVSLGTASTVNIPEEYRNFRFFKFDASNTLSHYQYLYFDSTRTDNIIFNTPPPEGAIIEVDYTFPGIAKDENHVLDMEIEISFGNHEE